MKNLRFVILILSTISLCACSTSQVKSEVQNAQLLTNPVAKTPIIATLPSLTVESTKGPDGTQPALEDAPGQKTQAARIQLEALIEELRGTMNASEYAALLKIETDWEKVARNHCEWQAAFFEGGSIQPAWFSDCLGQQYRQRIESLRLDLCEGYGMTGECAGSLKYKQEHP
jgi:hypothetical protein